MAIHDLSEDVAFAGVGGRLKLPAAMRASYGWMVAEGSYLMSECFAKPELITSQWRSSNALARCGSLASDLG